MSSFHGSWILQSQSNDGCFFLWGETWRSLASLQSSQDIDSVRVHPFVLSQAELLSLYDHNPSWQQWQTQNITLPSQKVGKGKVIPLLSGHLLDETIDKQSLCLASWQVGGFCLSPSETVEFLRSLPLNSLQAENSFVGSDLSYWCHIYRWSLDLLARGKYLPAISQISEDKAKAYWLPLLDSTVDQTRLAKFVRVMPAACRAYQFDSSPDEILLVFLNSIIDIQLRQWLDSNLPNVKASTVQPWLYTLSQNNSIFDSSTKETQRIKTAILNWTLPIQDYLFTSRIKQNQFRACFSLLPPSQAEINKGNIDWKLTYALQALDDPDFVIDSEIIWQYPVEELHWQGRTISQPQETFLKGLGLASRLYSPLADSLQQQQPSYCLLSPIQAYEFIRGIAWGLQDNGLGVILPPGLASGTGERRLGIKVKADVGTKPGERFGWQSLLNYKLDLAIGEQTISKKDFEKLLAAKSPIVEVNGEWLALQPTDVRAAQEILNKANEAEINLSFADAVRLQIGETTTLAKLPVVGFEPSGVLAEKINYLLNKNSLEIIEPPREFKGELRPYQLRGVSWLKFLESCGFGACLADDMGLGKTPQLIAFMLKLKEENALNAPTLIVCPTSVLNNWEREVKKFAPTLSAIIHHGDKRSKGKNFVKQVSKKDLVITSYALVFRDEATLKEVSWLGLVLDEAQNIKNTQAKQSQAVRKLTAGFRIALTGTPVENRLSELWSIMNFLNPSEWENQKFFQTRFSMPIEKYGDKEALQLLRSKVQPFILRRLKTDKDIIQDLPEKQELNVFCGLSAEQANLYQNLVDKSLQEIDEAEGIKRRGIILSLLLKLKQVCNHPAQFLKKKQLASSQNSGKLLRLEEMLEELIAEGDRALIFTQFSEWGKLLQPYLQKKLGDEVLFLYGATRRPQRQEMIDRFQNDPNGPHVFILSLKAGGTGLNLTRANHVFHVDRWWNPAVENQATDRAFRIGQKRNVLVHKFVCTGTLEEKINDMLESKKQLAEQIVDIGEDWLTELDTDQLRNLLLLNQDAILDE